MLDANSKLLHMWHYYQVCPTTVVTLTHRAPCHRGVACVRGGACLVSYLLYCASPNTRALDQWSSIQIGSDGQLLANAVRAALPTINRTVPLPPMPLFNFVALNEKICAPLGLQQLAKLHNPPRETDTTTCMKPSFIKNNHSSQNGPASPPPTRHTWAVNPSS